MTRDLDHPTTDVAVAAERAGRALQYVDLRRRLRLSVPQVAAATGYSEGYVGRWAHCGLTAIPVPEGVVETLQGLLYDRAVDDLRHLAEQGMIITQRAARSSRTTPSRRRVTTSRRLSAACASSGSP